MAITIIETKRGVNWLIGTTSREIKERVGKATLYAFRPNSLLQQGFLRGV